MVFYHTLFILEFLEDAIKILIYLGGKVLKNIEKEVKLIKSKYDKAIILSIKYQSKTMLIFSLMVKYLQKIRI